MNSLIDCPTCEGDFLAFMKATGRLCPTCHGSNKITEKRGDELFDRLFNDILAGLNAKIMKATTLTHKRGQNNETEND